MRVPPAHQRFETGHSSAQGLDLRLVVQFKLFRAQGLAQVFLQLELLYGASVHGFVVEAKVRAPVGLGGIHGRIGVFDQLVGAGAILRIHRDADAGCYHGVVGLQGDRFGQRVDDAPGDTLDVVDSAHIRQHHGELVAPQACDFRAAIAIAVVREIADGIVFAQFADQAPGNFHQQAVAAPVTDRIVDAFEVIQIDEQQRRVGARAFAAFEHAAQLLAETAPIRQAGQGIVVGQVAQAIFLALENAEGVARTQHVLHIAPQQRPVQGFDLVLGGAGAEAFVNRLVIVRAGDNRDRHVFALGHGADAAADFQTADARHFDIQQNEVGTLAHEGVEGRMTVLGFRNEHILGLQTLSGQQAHVHVVVGNENPRALLRMIDIIGHTADMKCGQGLKAIIVDYSCTAPARSRSEAQTPCVILGFPASLHSQVGHEYRLRSSASDSRAGSASPRSRRR